MEEVREHLSGLGLMRRVADGAPSPESLPSGSRHGPPPMVHGGVTPSGASTGNMVIDASASISSVGLPDWLRAEVSRSVALLAHYPEPESKTLRATIAHARQTSDNQVVVGNGSSELLAWLPAVAPQTDWVVPIPSYGEYQRAPALFGRRVLTVPWGELPECSGSFSRLEEHLDRPSVVVLGHPNNPTGQPLDLRRFEEMRLRHPDSLFVVDEAFGDLCDGHVSSFCHSAQNLLVLCSLTKQLAIPGLRLGYALGSAPLCRRLMDRLPPWSVNALAQRVGVRFFEDTEFLPAMRRELGRRKETLVAELQVVPRCRVHDTRANWVLLELHDSRMTAERVAEACMRKGVSLRTLSDFDGVGGQWLRIAVRTHSENQRIAAVLGEVLGARPAVAVTKRPRSLMLQGCSSDAGKSLLTAALCRCLHQDGFRVAPFKAQNMSNNSGVAADGGEMGRAQLVQALAAACLPDTRMNPVLLKPTSDVGAEVVLRGRAIGRYDVSSYRDLRPQLLAASLQAFDELRRDFDVVVCEGAGSSGEMNLRQADFVNMGFVEHREMPVVLVGDIDRGGVYASLIGHMEVLSEADRRCVKGFLVNRFRGDPGLLVEAHRSVEYRTGRPVLGVIPHLDGLLLPNEDRLSLQLGREHFGRSNAKIRIAAIVPPHVSNATDVDPLTVEDDVAVTLVEQPEQLKNPHVIVLLGTKNTLSDLLHLRRVGLDRAIIEASRKGAEVVGICGGLQMLGITVEDGEGVESSRKGVPGLSLLPIRTKFEAQKQLSRSVARHLPSGIAVPGYEIHYGTTDFSQVTPLFEDKEGRVIGGGLPEQRVWGTYLHGLFDSDTFRHRFLDEIRARLGLGALAFPRRTYTLAPVFSRLADTLRSHCDYPALLRAMGLT